MARPTIFIFASAVFLASCGHEAPDPYGGTPTQDFHVSVWMQDHPDLPKDELISGCSLWAPMGVTCTRENERTAAEIRVWASDAACKKEADGTVVLAWASEGGDITFNVKCFGRDLLGNLDLTELRTVMGHESGHQMGIWDHIPDTCDGPNVKTHPSGKKICGDALMNAAYDPNVTFITEPDALAFDVRTKDKSVLTKNSTSQPLLARDGDPSICIYRTK